MVALKGQKIGPAGLGPSAEAGKIIKASVTKRRNTAHWFNTPDPVIVLFKRDLGHLLSVKSLYYLNTHTYALLLGPSHQSGDLRMTHGHALANIDESSW